MAKTNKMLQMAEATLAAVGFCPGVQLLSHCNAAHLVTLGKERGKMSHLSFSSSSFAGILKSFGFFSPHLRSVVLHLVSGVWFLPFDLCTIPKEKGHAGGTHLHHVCSFHILSFLLMVKIIKTQNGLGWRRP